MLESLLEYAIYFLTIAIYVYIGYLAARLAVLLTKHKR